MAKTPTGIETEGVMIDAETFAEQSRQIGVLKSYYDQLGEKIKTLGFAEAIKQAREQTEAIKNLQVSVKDLSANYNALEKDIDDIGNALRESSDILRTSFQEIAKLEEERKKAYEESNKALEKLNINSKQSFADAKQSLDQQEAEIENIIQRNQLLENVEQQEKKLLNLQRQRALNMANESDVETQKIILEGAKREAQEQTGKLAEVREAKRKILIEEQKGLEIERAKLRQQEAAAMQPLLKFEELRLESLKKVNNQMAVGLDKLLLTSSTTSNMFASAFLASQKSIDGVNGGIGTMITNLKDGLTRSFLNPEAAANRFFNLISDRVFKSTLEFDKISASVNKATGGFRENFEGIAFSFGAPAIADLAKYGVNLESFSKTYGELSKSVSGFNNLGTTQRKILAESAASMEALGLSAASFGKIASAYMGAFGKSVEGARDMVSSLAKDAIALGKSVEEYTSAFEQAMSKVSGYGREAIKIFKELEAVSIATKGVVTSQDLLSISDKFQTFDTAAEAVSKLNAMLGGTSLSLIDMMKADPAEQIMMIKRAANEAALDFDKLNIGYKRLLAEYFGGDVKKAAAFFKADMLEAQSLMDKAALSEKELEEKKQQSAAAQEKINNLIDNMKISLTPVVELMNTFAEYLGKALSFPGGPLLATLSLIGLAFAGLQFAIYRIKVAAMQVGEQFVVASRTMAQNIEIVGAEIAHLNELLGGTAEAATVAAARVAALRAEGAAAGGMGGMGGGVLGGAAKTAGARGMSKVGIAGGVIGTIAIIGGGMMLSSKAESIKENQEIIKKQYEEYKRNETATVNPFTGEIPKGNDMEIRLVEYNGGKPNVQVVPIKGKKGREQLMPTSVGAGGPVAVLKAQNEELDRMGDDAKSPSLVGGASSTVQNNELRSTVENLVTQKYVSSTQALRDIKPTVYANLTIGRKQLGALGVEVAPTVAGELQSKESEYA